MPSTASQFVWYELMTTDALAAEAFYGHVTGWDIRDAGMPGMRYALLSTGGSDVAGLMALPADARAAGAQPGWMGYVGVDAVDAAAQRLQQAGGAVHRPPEDIPGVGRFAVVADPQGATFALFTPGSDQMPERPRFGTPGTIGWHELHAADGDAAFAFYSAQFGWTRGEAIDMGAMGVYQLFAAGGQPIGGMMTKTDAMPVPAWLYYVVVDDIDAAAARIGERGGQVANGPVQVPGGDWIVQAFDPQGAMFALVGPKR